MENPGYYDYAVLALICAGMIFEWRWQWPRYLRALRAGVPGARGRAYRNIVIAEWGVTIYVLALWAVTGRSWSALWLWPSSPSRLWLGLVLAAVIAALLVAQTKQILVQPKAIAKVREKSAFIEPLVPHTSGERRAFWLVSLTAGICEEIWFRGFLIWLFAAWTGIPLAIVISSILFGFGHAYLGWRQVPRTAIVGLALAVIVAASGSLVPAMVIHAALDMNSGELGFRIFRDAPAPSESTASPAS